MKDLVISRMAFDSLSLSTCYVLLSNQDFMKIPPQEVTRNIKLQHPIFINITCLISFCYFKRYISENSNIPLSFLSRIMVMEFSAEAIDDQYRKFLKCQWIKLDKCYFSTQMVFLSLLLFFFFIILQIISVVLFVCLFFFWN